jgi:hypothetical protein
MISMMKQYGLITFALIGALAIIGTAWWANERGENDDTWLYIFAIWLILYAAYEVYSKKKKDK